jgi:hypothetical protein
MFKFAIRDDDPNYFTSPSELETAYSDLPDHIPISYAVVPFHGCTQTPAIPEDKWEGTEEYPLADNTELVSYLKEGLSDGSHSVMLHGYNHVKYPSGPEFVAGDNLENRIQQGKAYLEELLETEVNIFVPPNNSFSRAGLDAVKSAGMATFYYPTPFDRPRTPEVAFVTSRDLWFKYRNKTGGMTSFLKDADRFWRRGEHDVFMPVRPFPYEIRGVPEVTSVSLTRTDGGSHIERIKQQMELADRRDGVFCLAVHYHSFSDDSFRGRFYDLISYARNYLNPEFVCAEQLFN